MPGPSATVQHSRLTNDILENLTDLNIRLRTNDHVEVLIIDPAASLELALYEHFLQR